MSDDFPLKNGDTATPAQLSLCVGGMIRTWTDTGHPRLWSVADAEYLHTVQGTGSLARTLHEERRFREVGLLSEETDTLLLQSRFPTATDDGTLQLQGSVVHLSPAGEPSESTYQDVLSLLAQAINSAMANHEFIVVEKGGWDAPSEPFCLFIVIPETEGFVSIIETAPPPRRSEIWRPHIVAGRHSTTLSAPATRGSIDVAPTMMVDAISTWGVQPWDLALTFGTLGSR